MHASDPFANHWKSNQEVTKYHSWHANLVIDCHYQFINQMKCCTDTREKTTYMSRTGDSGSWMFQRWNCSEMKMFSEISFKHLPFGTVSVWVVDDNWQSFYKLNFVFSGADVLCWPTSKNCNIELGIFQESDFLTLRVTSELMCLNQGQNHGMAEFQLLN